MKQGGFFCLLVGPSWCPGCGDEFGPGAETVEADGNLYHDAECIESHKVHQERHERSRPCTTCGLSRSRHTPYDDHDYDGVLVW